MGLNDLEIPPTNSDNPDIPKHHDAVEPEAPQAARTEPQAPRVEERAPRRSTRDIPRIDYKRVQKHGLEGRNNLTVTTSGTSRYRGIEEKAAEQHSIVFTMIKFVKQLKRRRPGSSSKLPKERSSWTTAGFMTRNSLLERKPSPEPDLWSEETNSKALTMQQKRSTSYLHTWTRSETFAQLLQLVTTSGSSSPWSQPS